MSYLMNAVVLELVDHAVKGHDKVIDDDRSNDNRADLATNVPFAVGRDKSHLMAPTATFIFTAAIFGKCRTSLALHQL